MCMRGLPGNKMLLTGALEGEGAELVESIIIDIVYILENKDATF